MTIVRVCNVWAAVFLVAVTTLGGCGKSDSHGWTKEAPLLSPTPEPILISVENLDISFLDTLPKFDHIWVASVGTDSLAQLATTLERMFRESPDHPISVIPRSDLIDLNAGRIDYSSSDSADITRIALTARRAGARTILFVKVCGIFSESPVSRPFLSGLLSGKAVYEDSTVVGGSFSTIVSLVDVASETATRGLVINQPMDTSAFGVDLLAARIVEAWPYATRNWSPVEEK